MAKLPPPPVVGRSRPADADADELDRAAAESALPSSVTDLPDAWLLEAETAMSPPAAAERGAATEIAELEAGAPLGAAGLEAAELIDDADVVDDTATPPPVAATAAPVEPPPSVTAPRATTTRVEPPPAPAPGNRRTMIAVAGVLGTALVAVLIARCNGESVTPTTGRDTIAGARVDGGTAAPSTVATAPPRTAGDGAAGNAEAAGTNAGGDRAAGAGGGVGAGSGAAEPSAEADAAPAEVAAAAPTDPAGPPSAAAPAPDEPTIEPAAATPTPSDPATPASTTKPAARPASRTDAASTSGTASTEGPMTAAESLERARAAWKAGNAKDTYKYANKSRFKEPSAEATELATLAACKMKLDDAAKSTFKQLEGDRKKRTRAACRDFGVRVGL